MNDKWKVPPIIKVYEALGALADGRLESVTATSAQVYSSSGNKYYDVTYDSKAGSIMTNDNGSYWQGYLGYPSITFLMQQEVLSFNETFAEALKGIPWKAWNTKYKNDFDKTLEAVDEHVAKNGSNPSDLRTFCENVVKEIEKLNLAKLGPCQKPPTGY